MRNPPPSPKAEALTQRAFEEFGEAHHSGAGFYLFPDGRWLSGDEGDGSRGRDHRMAGDLLDDEDAVPHHAYGARSRNMHTFMRLTGAIRHMPEANGFDAVYPPTQPQMRAMMRAHRENPRQMSMMLKHWPDFEDESKSTELHRPNMEDIHDFFHGHEDDEHLHEDISMTFEKFLSEATQALYESHLRLVSDRPYVCRVADVEDYEDDPTKAIGVVTAHAGPNNTEVARSVFSIDRKAGSVRHNYTYVHREHRGTGVGESMKAFAAQQFNAKDGVVHDMEGAVNEADWQQGLPPA